jgi:hypothetical protein
MGGDGFDSAAWISLGKWLYALDSGAFEDLYIKLCKLADVRERRVLLEQAMADYPEMTTGGKRQAVS